MRIIKKYPNRRLYDTEKSAYIKLSEVHEIIRSGQEFQVVDADTGEDITRSILVQIIIEQENGETPIFTTDMLTKFIRFYDDATHNLFGEFLDKNLQFFGEQQKKLKEQVEGIIEAHPIPKIVHDMTERNIALWQDMQQRFFDIASGGTARKSPKKGEKE